MRAYLAWCAASVLLGLLLGCSDAEEPADTGLSEVGADTSGGDSAADIPDAIPEEVQEVAEEEPLPEPEVWRVLFFPNIDVSTCRAGVQWCCQNLMVQADGSFDESWAPNEPETATVSGEMTESAFDATLSCFDGEPSTTLSAARTGAHYEGEFSFGTSSGGFMVVRDDIDTVSVQGIVVRSGDFAPVAGAVVTASVDAEASATTNAHGMFFLLTDSPTEFSSTPHTISIAAEGYQPFSQEHTWGDHAWYQQFQLVQ